jgi:ADP-heptose:LPS heptosyltransferase
MKAGRFQHGEGWHYGVLGEVARRLVRRTHGSAIAVYSPGHLGDILHVVPMLKALRAAKPEVPVIWVVGPWSEALARRYGGGVDEIRVFGPDLPAYTRGRREWRQGVWRQWQIAADLHRAGAETLIGPLGGPGRFLANAIRPRRWVGIGEWCPPRVQSGIQVHAQPYEKDRYEADAWCGLLKPLGIEAGADRLEYAVTAAEREAAEVVLKTSGVALDKPLAVIAPGSGWKGKNWLPDRFGQVAEWLGREQGFQVAWAGGGGEETLVPPARASDIQWVGKTTLPLLAALLESARLFVGNDSGLLHLAAALGVPTVSIWGPTRPGKWGPRGPKHRQIRKVEHCDGCIYWDYRETCRHDHECMQAVQTDDVQHAILDVLHVQSALHRPIGPSKRSTVER